MADLEPSPRSTFSDTLDSSYTSSQRDLRTFPSEKPCLFVSFAFCVRNLAVKKGAQGTSFTNHFPPAAANRGGSQGQDRRHPQLEAVLPPAEPQRRSGSPQPLTLPQLGLLPLGCTRGFQSEPLVQGGPGMRDMQGSEDSGSDFQAQKSLAEQPRKLAQQLP